MLRNRAKPPPRNPDWIVNIGRHRPPPQMGRQLIAPIGRFASLAKGLKLAASTEAGLAVAAGGLAYGLGEHAVEAYKHHQTSEKFRKEGYTEIRAKPRPSDPTQSQRVAAHTTSHVHQTPPQPEPQHSPTYTKVISNGEQTFHPPNSEAPPAPLTRPRVTHRHEPLKPIESQPPPQTPPQTPPQPIEATAADTPELNTSTVEIKPFRIGDKPYNLVQWEANTHEIAERMMSGLS